MGLLEGKTAVIVGAAEKGNMGQAIARRYRAEGAAIVVASRRTAASCFMTGQVLQVNGGLTLRRNPLRADLERAEREDRERVNSEKSSGQKVK
jgi:NAD(P)-dependent dehydrogenase (short-subunit alcohol dehydrogenase family)